MTDPLPTWLTDTLAAHPQSPRRRLPAREPRPGDIYIAARGSVRMAIVVVEVGRHLVSAVPADPDIDWLTDQSPVLEASETGLPYALAVRFDLPGPVARGALVERIGSVAFGRRDLRRAAALDPFPRPAFASRRIGLPLHGPADARVALMDELVRDLAVLGAAEPTDAYRRVSAQRIPSCDACGAPLERDLSGLANEALFTLGGGYGSFVDDIHRGGPYAYIVCEACARRACEALGLTEPLAEHATSAACACSDRERPDTRD